MHVDTGYKFTEMYEFRDRCVQEIGADLLVWRNEPAITAGANPFDLGTQNCCGFLKTEALLTGLRHHRFDAAIGGARRDEEKSRAKERIFSFRTAQHRWDPKNQRPELWRLYNARHRRGESLRVFPLSNWTELDVWQYINVEQIPIVPLYFAKEREVVVRGASLIMREQSFVPLMPGERTQMIKCRMRSLGCSPCTGAIRSDADTRSASTRSDSILTSWTSTSSFVSTSATRSRAVAACSSAWRSAVAELSAENTSLRVASTSASSPSISRCAVAYASNCRPTRPQASDASGDIVFGMAILLGCTP
jgi:sulfate adenylyltransferase small subunit